MFQTQTETSLQILNTIYAKNLEYIFINTSITLKILCILLLTVSNVERAFNKLRNQLKQFQRASLSQKVLILLVTFPLKINLL